MKNIKGTLDQFCSNLKNSFHTAQEGVMFWRKTTESYKVKQLICILHELTAKFLTEYKYLLLNPVLILCQKEFKVCTYKIDTYFMHDFLCSHIMSKQREAGCHLS